MDEVHLSCWFYDIVRAKMCLSPAVPLCGGQVVSSQPLSCVRLNTKIYLSKMQDVFVLHSGSQLVSSEIQSQPLKSQLMDKVKAFKSFQRDWFGIKIQTKSLRKHLMWRLELSVHL